MRLKLSSYLIGIISRVLVPSLDHTSMIPLFEVMTITSSVQNNIRGEKDESITS